MDIASENYTHFQTFSSKVEDWILVLINNNRLSKTANNFFYLQNICDNSNAPIKKIIITSHYNLCLWRRWVNMMYAFLDRASFNIYIGGAKAPPAPVLAPPLKGFGPPS